MANRNGATWTAFLVMCFLAVGLTGLFATFASTVPLYRALAQSAALDEVLAVSRRPDSAAQLDRLRPRLGESAAGALGGDGTVEERVTRERSAMRARQEHEAEGVAWRIRVMVVVVTVMATLFGVFIMGLSRR